MESSEDDRGAARDVVEQTTTRENEEKPSGVGETSAILTSVQTDGENSRSMEAGTSSSVADEDVYHNTETILNMIDEFIDEPKPTKSAKYTADSTVSEHTPPRVTPASSSLGYNERTTENCVVSETPQETVKSSQDLSVNRCHVKDKQLEDMVNDISSSSTNQGTLESGSRVELPDSNTICDPTESCSKSENLPGLRKKLIRPNVSTREASKLTSSKHLEENFNDDDKQDASLSNVVQSSAKKVKLVRHSNVKAKALVVTQLPSTETPHQSSSDCLSSDTDRVKDRLKCHEQSSSKPLDLHSSRECLGNESVNNFNKEVDDKSKELSCNVNVKLLDNSSDVKIVNSLNNELDNDNGVVVNKSNDVLDVRKVSPLRLNLSNIDESHIVQHNDIVINNQLVNLDEINMNYNRSNKKMLSKQNDKYDKSRLNIKPIKAPDVNVDNVDLPACSTKSKRNIEDVDENSDIEQSNIPNVIKLNIKPLHKPDLDESDSNCKIKSSSSSSEVSECESSESEVANERIQSPTIETSECDQQAERSVPKLTIKSLSTIPKVDCESHKHKIGRRSQSPEQLVVPKLHIKPIIPPPIEKMTIKLNKTHESEFKCESEVFHAESVPKMTIKLGKSQENIAVFESESKFEMEHTESVPKMTIKLGKNQENIAVLETDTESDVEYTVSVPKMTIKLGKSQENIAILETESKFETELMESVPKMTIKLGKHQETSAVIESDSKNETEHTESVPKMTIKLGKVQENAVVVESESRGDTDHVESVPKMTIKLGKVQENAAVVENNCDDENIDCALKMKIKLGKSIENSLDTNSDNPSEHCHVTRSSKRLNQRHEPLEQHVPKLTIKIPQEHETKSTEKSSNSPSIPKLTIKPIIKPEEIERSSSPTVPKLTIKPIPKPDDQHDKHDESADHPSIPKLLIKSVKSDDHVDRSASPNITKLNIKPVVKPDEIESKSPDSVDSHTKHSNKSVKKLTIKPVIKYDENDLKHSQGPSSPSIPKLTIKPIIKHDDLKMDSSDIHPERCTSPTVPKLTIKPVNKTSHESTETVDVPVVHKLTIKPILKPSEQPVEESSNAVSKSVIGSESDGLLTKISIKPILKPSDKDVNVESGVEKTDEVIIRTRSKTASLEETISKLSSKTKSVSEKNIGLSNDFEVVTQSKTKDDKSETSPKFTIEPVPENLIKPLEVTTSFAKGSPSHQESGLDSPRIILKINKCAQGSVSEVLIDEVQNKNEKLIKEITSNDVEPHDAPEKEKISPVNKDVIINEPPVETKVEPVAMKNEVGEEKPVNDVDKDEATDKVEETNETSKENNEKLVRSGSKRLRARETLSNKLSKATTQQSKRQKLDNAITNLHNKNKRNTSLAIIPSKEESVNIPSEKSTPDDSLTNSTDVVVPKNGETNFKDALSNIKGVTNEVEKSDTFVKTNESSAIAEGDSNTTSTRSSEEASEVNQLGTDSPVFNKVDRNMLVLNDETNSQECMMIDELSQDPLDIESAAKSHFTPITATTKPILSIKDTIKIVEQTPEEIAISLGLTPQPKKRGRPRKYPVPEDQPPTPAKPPKAPKVSPKLPTPALEERPVRVLRTPRDKPAILRTPNTRGNRGRGGNRRGGANSGIRDFATSPPDSPVEKAIKFFDLGSNDADGTITPCKVSLSRLDDSCDEEERSFTRGRGGGRIRRGRGSRGGRGKGSRGGLLRGGQRGEEIQLQDALPLPTPIGRREGRKSRLEPTLTPALQVFEEETCMSVDNVTPKGRNINLVDEESQSSVLSGNTASESGTRSKRPRLMDMLDEGHKEWTPADVAEYDWPPDGFSSGEPSQTVMIQEQVALYLGVKSFKRRYPDLKRRPLSAEEKNYIRDRGLISEALCDLGVTAVDAGEVLDIMFTDYPDKYEEYRKHLREKREAKPGTTSTSKLAFAPTPAKQSVSKQEILEKACESAASWNAQLNKQRKTQRTASMDLQTLTLHKPKRPQVVQEPNPRTLSYYPVALLPGQFTDFYRDYTPEELRYFPLNTVMNLLPSPKLELQSSSEESDSNSDSERSSGAESDSENSIIETNTRRKAPLTKTKARQSVGNTSRPISPSIDSTPHKTENGNVKSEGITASSSSTALDVPNKCKVCEGSEFSNKRNPNEAFITCATCQKKIHPSCLDMSTTQTKCVRNYAWQCADCKCCGQCGDLADDDKMLFCDLCDRGYHIYCVGLKKVPTGRWHCGHCAVCRSCDSRTPSGPPGVESVGPGAPPDQWHHHFRRTNSGQRIYSHTLCAPCARAWQSGRFCPSCEKCFVGRKGAMGLVICVRCDMRYHQECIRQVRKQLDVLNFTCSNCRRGINPKHKLRRGERTPRKMIQLSTDNSMHSIVTDSNSSMQNTSSMMDQEGESSSAIDSMLPSPSQDRNNDSDSISDVPLDKMRQALEKNEDVDFKSATRRLFSVDESGNKIPSNLSEYRIPSISSAAGKRKTEDNSIRTSSKSEKSPEETGENMEGGT